MKLLVTINAGELTRELPIQVGDGKQTIKWMAYAASYRLVHSTNRHVPVRDRSALPVKTQLLPKDVRTEDCPFLHPDDRIAQHLSDGQQVIVDLYTSLDVDEYGTPVLSPWAFIAFNHDERHQEERSRLAEEKKLEVETYLTEREEAALQAKLAIEQPKIQFMTGVMQAQLISEVSTIEGEWSLIQQSGILDNIVPDSAQQEEIKAFLVKYFVELNDLYKFYSAVNSGGGTHTLEYIELCKFLTETGIFGADLGNAILRIFIDSHIKSGKGRGQRPSIHTEIRRYEFFVALLKIAILKNITLPKRELSRLRKKGHQVSISKANLPTPPRALEMIYDEFLSPVLEKMPAGRPMRASVGSDSVLILMYDNLDKLVRCFEKYAAESDEDDELANDTTNADEKQVSIPTGSLSIKEFSFFTADAGFVDEVMSVQKRSHGRKHSIMGNRTNDGVTQKDVRQIFSASQHDNIEANESEKQKVAEDDNISSHQELMIFSEWLEAICRLGVLKYHSLAKEADGGDGLDNTLSHHACIKLAVEKVCKMMA